MLYHLRETQRAFLNPMATWAQASAQTFTSPGSPLSSLPGAQRIAAGYELFYRLGKEYAKPQFGIASVTRNGRVIPVSEVVALERPFARLLAFQRFSDDPATVKLLKGDPSVLLCAPLAGHHATLLRDTATQMLQDHKVYITDWTDARTVPTDQGLFHLDEYISYIRQFIRHIGAEHTHVVAVCQSCVPVLAAIALMAQDGEPTPRSLTVMGGPIDGRRSPTAVNSLATTHSFEWFENTVIQTVPARYPGAGRRVYPGFLQHFGFVAMNAERHFQSHWDYYQSVVKGNRADAGAHELFYDEYNAVLDMDAAYYLDTIRAVFQEFRLAQGTLYVNGQLVQPAAITKTAILSVEGELDDISGSGQTAAAHDLCINLPAAMQAHYTAPRSGHYGIFSGKHWRESIYPLVRDFIRQNGAPLPAVRSRKAAAAH